MHLAEPGFFESLWRRAVDDSLDDASGFTVRGVLRLLKIHEVEPEHVEALWRVLNRSPRFGDRPQWEEILDHSPLPGFPRWLHKSPTEIATSLGVEPNNARQILYRARQKMRATL